MYASIRAVKGKKYEQIERIGVNNHAGLLIHENNVGRYNEHDDLTPQAVIRIMLLRKKYVGQTNNGFR